MTFKLALFFKASNPSGSFLEEWWVLFSLSLCAFPFVILLLMAVVGKTAEKWSWCHEGDSPCVWCNQTSKLLCVPDYATAHKHIDTQLYSFIMPTLSSSHIFIAASTDNNAGGVCVCVWWWMTVSGILLPLHHSAAIHPLLQWGFMSTQQVMLVLCPELMRSSWLFIFMKKNILL